MSTRVFVDSQDRKYQTRVQGWVRVTRRPDPEALKGHRKRINQTRADGDDRDLVLHEDMSSTYPFEIPVCHRVTPFLCEPRAASESELWINTRWLVVSRLSNIQQ